MKNILFDFISNYISMNDEEKNVLLLLDLFRTEKKGTILLRHEQHSKESFFFFKGCIRTYYLIDGEEKTTSFYTEIDALTPHCVINKAPSEHYISCVQDSILSIFNADIKVEFNGKFPKFDLMCRKLS